MELRRWARVATIGLAVGGMAGAQASPQAKERHASSSTVTMSRPDALQWGAAPPSLPKGAQAVVLQGDPASKGTFALRLKAPDGYEIPPHTHPTDEVITVLSGTFHLGMGRTFNKDAAQAYPEGSFLVMPAGMAHFAYTEGNTIVQIQGRGPFVIHYINPKDDPQRQGVGGSGEAQPQSP